MSEPISQEPTPVFQGTAEDYTKGVAAGAPVIAKAGIPMEKIHWDKNIPGASPETVNRPSHYTQYQGFEVMDVCTQLRSRDGSGNWFRGNVFKYLARAGWKDPAKELEDLRKAAHYLEREIQRVRDAQESVPGTGFPYTQAVKGGVQFGTGTVDASGQPALMQQRTAFQAYMDGKPDHAQYPHAGGE